MFLRIQSGCIRPLLSIRFIRKEKRLLETSSISCFDSVESILRSWFVVRFDGAKLVNFLLGDLIFADVGSNSRIDLPQIRFTFVEGAITTLGGSLRLKQLSILFLELLVFLLSLNVAGVKRPDIL